MRFISRFELGAALAVMSIAALPVAAQTAAKTEAKPAAAKSAIPRLPDGHPDLQGTYDLATMTPLERMPGDPAFYTKAEAEKLIKQEMDRRAVNATHLDPNRPNLPVGGDNSQGHSFFERLERAGGGAVGGYDRLWLNQGTTFNIVDGQVRTSIVIDPPDGHVPPFNAAAKARNAGGRGQRPTSDQGENQDIRAVARRGEYDNPEQRPLSERCLLGFGSTAGPPALPDYFYNDLHQIVQTKDSVMILSEMIHDARVVRMNAQHLPQDIRRWMGDSVGHWEGDTLVVDTTNFTDKTRFHGATENLHVIERFSRIDAKTLLYRFTVEDPQTWDHSWTGEMAWPATSQPIYEYACQEGNYALGDVLRGARHQEAEEPPTSG
ncbi:MAG TPA: hypothetical protein VK419_09020, partial [Bryobacteraceae bacterium]|nr:hypothetical protein [Bryobacteraceae bacterium]